MLDIELPERVEYIRVIVVELQRIASHLVACGVFGLDVGAITPFTWALRDRERILDLFETLCGARLLYNYIWVGGVSHDLPKRFIEKTIHSLLQTKPFQLSPLLIPPLLQFDSLRSYPLKVLLIGCFQGGCLDWFATL